MEETNKRIDLKKIKEVAEGFLIKIAPEVLVNEVSFAENTIMIGIKVDDPQMFIGQNMETLLAIQHLLRVVLRKVVEGVYYVDLDINGYKKKRREYLKEMAISTANEVSLAKREVALSPMSAYERRIVHMELSERRDIVTESRGSGIDRRIIVKPA